MDSDIDDFDYAQLDYEEADSSEEEAASETPERLYSYGKDISVSDTGKARQAFLDILKLTESTPPSPWTFKALKHLTRLCIRTGKLQEATTKYMRLFELAPEFWELAKNSSESKRERPFIKLLTQFLSSPQLADAVAFLRATISRIESVKALHGTGKRLALAHMRELARALFAKNNASDDQELADIVTHIEESHLRDSASLAAGLSFRSSPEFIELCALKMQLYTRFNDIFKLRDAWNDYTNARASASNIITIATIAEYGGRMFMEFEEWKQARDSFFNAFKIYNDTGNVARFRTLNYYIFACIFSRSEIDPFDAQDMVSYKNRPETAMMPGLIKAFLNHDYDAFKKILAEHADFFARDAVLSKYLENLRYHMLKNVLQRFVVPFSELQVSYIAKKVDIPNIQLMRKIIKELISEERIYGYMSSDADPILHIYAKPPVPADKAAPSLERSMVRLTCCAEDLAKFLKELAPLVNS